MFKFDDPKMGRIKILNVTEARSQLASLLSDKQADYIITKNNKPQRVVINYEEFERLKSLGGSASPLYSVAARPGETAVTSETVTEQGCHLEESPRPPSRRVAPRKQPRKTPPRHVKGLLAEQGELSARSFTPPESRYGLNTPDVRRETTVEITPEQKRRLLNDAMERARATAAPDTTVEEADMAAEAEAEVVRVCNAPGPGEVETSEEVSSRGADFVLPPADTIESAASAAALSGATAAPAAVWPDQGPTATISPGNTAALETAVIRSMAEETVEQDYFASDTAQDDAMFGEEAGIPSPDEAQGVAEKSAVIKDLAPGAHGVTGQKTTQDKLSQEVSDEVTDKARVRPPSREGQPRRHTGTASVPAESSPEADYYRRFKKLYEPVDPAVVAPSVPKKFAGPSPSHVAIGAGNRQAEDRRSQAVPTTVQQASPQVPPSSGNAENFGAATASGVTAGASAVSPSAKVPMRAPKTKESGTSTDLPSLQDLLRDLESERLSDEGEKLDDKQIDDLIHRITNDY